MIKPPTLFHASTAKDIMDVLEPRPNKTIGGEEGEFVFAGEDRLAAMAYALKTDEMMCIHFMHVDGLEPLHMAIIRDREKAMRDGIEGTIYEVPSDTFRNVKYNGHDTYEWVSEAPVEVDKSRSQRVSLESAMEAGVQVFFAHPNASRDLVKQVYDPDANVFEKSKLAGAFNQGALIWENQRRGIDPISNPSRFKPIQPRSEQPRNVAGNKPKPI